MDLLKLAKILDTPLEEFFKDEMLVYNIPYSSLDHQSKDSTFQQNELEVERKLWEKLLASKEAELVAERRLLEVQTEELSRLREKINRLQH